jgi:hypothetical protein
LKEHLKFPAEKWTELRKNAEFWFTADKAIGNGLATTVGDFAPPIGTKLFSVYPFAYFLRLDFERIERLFVARSLMRLELTRGGGSSLSAPRAEWPGP